MNQRRPLLTGIGLLLTLSLLLGVPSRVWSGSGDGPAFASRQGRSSGIENLLSTMSQEVAAKVLYEMQEEGQEVVTLQVAVVCAVPLSDLKRETEFGRVVAEYYLTDLADRNIQVKELRLGQDISIMPQTGEFILSQNIGELANDSPELDYVVVSTFSNTRSTLILQGRMISLATGLVKTSWRYNFPLNREVMALLGVNTPPYAIAVKGMGESSRAE